MKKLYHYFLLLCVVFASCKKDDTCAVCYIERSETILAKTTVTRGNDTTFCDIHQKASFAAVNTYTEAFTTTILVGSTTSSAEGVRKVQVNCSK
jgi:hypothetical protein